MTGTTRRRTQEERTAATRAAILGAAIECLVTDGYAATSTSAIQQRAGVSRGALTHHFPARDDLLVAAIDHLAEQRRAEMRDAVDALTGDRDRSRAALRLVYRQFAGDLFVAALELWNAARTEAALHEALVRTERDIGRQNRVLLHDILGPEITSRPGFDGALDSLFEWLRGLAVTNLLRSRPPDEDEIVDRGIRLLLGLSGPPPG
ncbi:MAG: TetR/AcrR family transcriptional regulator [Actinomycetota bacterium]|nr:TetR/AcrR family transcriptional regulator [Actinomycetota bacterium]